MPRLRDGAKGQVMEVELELNQQKSPSSKKWKNWFWIAFDLWVLYLIFFESPWRHSILTVLLGLILIFSLGLNLISALSPNTAYALFGQIQYVQISSPALEQRLRARYRISLQELQALGFTPLFAKAETFSPFRLLLVYPAVVLLFMLIKREVIAIHAGRLISARLILASSDRIAYANPSGLGVKFHTLLKNGALLISANFGSDSSGPSFTFRSFPGATLQETWTNHQHLVQSRVTKDNPVAMKFTFDEYIEIIR
jgi:hypothetical protein